MTVHPTSSRSNIRFQPPRPAGGSAAPNGHDAGTADPARSPARKFNFRKLLMTGAAVAVLAGAAWYGWDYWTVGHYPRLHR